MRKALMWLAIAVSCAGILLLAFVAISAGLHPPTSTADMEPAPIIATSTPAPAATPIVAPVTPAVAPAAAPAKKSPGEETVYKASSGEGKRYHLEDCRTLTRGKTALSRAQAEAEGLTPCGVCNP